MPTDKLFYSLTTGLHRNRLISNRLSIKGISNRFQFLFLFSFILLSQNSIIISMEMMVLPFPIYWQFHQTIASLLNINFQFSFLLLKDLYSVQFYKIKIFASLVLNKCMWAHKIFTRIFFFLLFFIFNICYHIQRYTFGWFLLTHSTDALVNP